MTVDELLDGRVGLDLECLDRIYLNGYVPSLQAAGQVVSFMTMHLGMPIPSPAIMERMGTRFRRGVASFAEDNHIPLVRSARSDLNKDGKVDVFDLSLLLSARGICPPPPVTPPPVTPQPVTRTRVPAGPSVWIKRSGKTHEMLRLWRSGEQLRIYRDEGRYPDDGLYCSWGTLRGKKFVGREQRVAPEPVAVRYTIRKIGNRLRVLGLTGFDREDRRPWRRSSVKRYKKLVPESGTGQWCRTFKSAKKS